MRRPLLCTHRVRCESELRFGARSANIRWPYKFVHALLEIVEKQGNLNIQTHTPVTSVSDADEQGAVTVKTERGSIKARTVFHATVSRSVSEVSMTTWLTGQNRWAGHLLKDFDNLIVAGRGTLAAIKAPEGFLKHTGAQHWDAVVNVSCQLFCHRGAAPVLML